MREKSHGIKSQNDERKPELWDKKSIITEKVRHDKNYEIKSNIYELWNKLKSLHKKPKLSQLWDKKTKLLHTKSLLWDKAKIIW